MKYNQLLNSGTSVKWQKIGINRKAGVAVPLFSVFSNKSIGVGEIPDLRYIIDWCCQTGMSVLQLLPLNEVGNDFAPYNSVSTFALEPMYLSIKRLRKADHIMIFINIAASYTPTCMLALSGSLGAGLLIAVWSSALVGIVIKLFWMSAPRWLSTSIYLIMGWLAVIVIIPLFNVLPVAALIWLFTGGLFFTVGAVIYARKKPDPFPGVLGFHEIFHIFVLLGSFSHFIMIYKYIALM